MANQEHLEILARGVTFWNSWREMHPEVRPDLEGANLRNACLNTAELQGVNLQGADLQGARLEQANLEGANLQGAILKGARLWKAHLVKANLLETDLTFVHMKKANLTDANLQRAILLFAELQNACLIEANLRGADLQQANLTKADLRKANVKDTSLLGTDFSDANVFWINYNRGKSRYQGIRVDSCHGSQKFKSHAMDQAYIEEFREKSRINKILYYLWLITSDCGRSMLIWAAWSAVILALFAWKYHQLGPTNFNFPPCTWGDDVPIYFSFVTFSTLGFGDIYPLTFAARMWVIAEVMTGYIMLGGLISILANKLAKRA